MTQGPREPVDCARCGKIHTRCTGHRTTGEACQKWPRAGSTVCDAHGGAAPQVRARAEVRAEVMAWGLTDTHVDPGELMLRLVAQSAARVEFYGSLVGRAYDAAERLRQAQSAPESDSLAAETARLDLERVLNEGGVAVLVGHTYSGTQQNGVIATGEAIRGLLKLESEERDRAMNFAAKAKAAGIAAEQLELWKRLGSQAMAAMLGLAVALGRSGDDPDVRELIRSQIEVMLGSGRTIEGALAA